MCYFNLVFTFENFYHLFNEHNSSCSNLLKSCGKPLDKLLVQQANVEISLFVKELLLFFIIAPWEKTQINFTTYCIYTTRKNESKPFLIVIMVAKIGCLYSKWAPKRQNLILCHKTVVPLHHYTVRKNTNKSHHLSYLWQQKKLEPKLSLIVIMVTRKNEPTLPPFVLMTTPKNLLSM